VKVEKTRLFFPALLAAAAVLAGLAVGFSPPSQPSPAYLADARELLAGGVIASDFEKVGYPIFLWAGLTLGGMAGIYLGQAGLYLGTVALSWFLLRRTGVSRRWALGTAALVALHPVLLLNITRVVDSGLSVFLLLCLSAALLRTPASGWIRAGAAGVLAGITWLTRPNYVLILALIPLEEVKSRLPRARRLLCLAATGAAALGTAALLTWWACGKVRLMTTDGNYALFTGANPWTARMLLAHGHTEGYTPQILTRMGIDPERPDIDRVYRELSLDFIRRHPLRYLGFGVLKVVNVFRPDYSRLAVSTTVSLPWALAIFQTILALPFPVWAAVRMRRGKAVGWRSPLRAGLFLLLFILPLFIYSSSCRYRLPFDVLLILDTARTLYLTRRGVGT